MNVAHVRLSRRSFEIGAALVALVSLAIGAHAALSKRTETAKPITARVDDRRPEQPKRLALVIGNGHYPDAAAPLIQPINDARAVTAALRRDGFEVDVVEDASREDMIRALDRLTGKLNPETTVLLYFGGYGAQAGRENFMLPVDAKIWKERDVRHEGVSIESALQAMTERGAQAKLVVLDASRRNPYERRFRGYSHGLGAIDAPSNALILSSAIPGRVVDDVKGENSMLAAQLLANLNGDAVSAEALFGNVRAAVTRQTDGEQVPSVSSSLTGEVSFGPTREARAGS